MKIDRNNFKEMRGTMLPIYMLAACRGSRCTYVIEPIISRTQDISEVRIYPYGANSAIFGRCFTYLENDWNSFVVAVGQFLANETDIVDFSSDIKELQLVEKFSLPDFIRDVAQFSDGTFGGDPARIVGIANHLVDESKELLASVMDLRSMPETTFRTLELGFEVADVIILALDVARKAKIDPESIPLMLIRKMEINKSRNWGSPDSRGVVRHIKQ
ncbi:DUF550 domain-containing protein [Candidatus Nomurabacteria bacterium]|nr:DUF550 domain-containing protein [Candidatus Nomurabacteria bacterium]